MTDPLDEMLVIFKAHHVCQKCIHSLPTPSESGAMWCNCPLPEHVYLEKNPYVKPTDGNNCKCFSETPLELQP